MFPHRSIGFTFLFAFSVFWLTFSVVHLWIMGREPLSFEEYVPREPSSLNVQLEEAKVSKVGEKGKEWELWATSIEQKNDQVFLQQVSGIVFRGGTPFYRLSAEKGVMLLSDGNATLWGVELREEKGGKVIRGEKLSFSSERKEFVLYRVDLKTPDMKARCGKLVYNVVQRTMKWEENVEIRIGMP